MSTRQEASLIIKLRFEERNKNFLGFALVIVDPKGLSVVKCAVAVNYFSERFSLQVNLLQPWPGFLSQIESAMDTIRDMLPKDYAGKIERLYSSYPLERLEQLIDVGLRESNTDMQMIMLETLLKDDLSAVFPTGDIYIEFTIEPVEEGETAPDDEAGGGEDIVAAAVAAEEETETITLVDVNPVIDAHAGMPAGKLKLDDVIMVKMEQQTDTQIRCRVVAVMIDKKHLNEVLVRVDLSGGRWGEMTVPRYTMIHCEQPQKPESKSSRFNTQELALFLILALAVLLFVAMIIAMAMGFW